MDSTALSLLVGSVCAKKQVALLEHSHSVRVMTPAFQVFLGPWLLKLLRMLQNTDIRKSLWSSLRKQKQPRA